MSEARLNICRTRDIPFPTYYVKAIQTEFAAVAYDEERAQEFKGHWREKSFGVGADVPLDLEIGTGNGYFFAHRAVAEPSRCLLGLEIKFKPLIQSIRRALNAGSKNARIARFHAALLDVIIADGELNHVFVHHPDPWSKRNKQKRRLMNRDFLMCLLRKQRPGSFLDFKTDSHDYFIWACEEIKNTSYVVERFSEDLHNSEWSSENFVTQFERIFISKGQPIYYLRARVPGN
jgi:tRNA (guanine-N7-)-methyltransferase